MISTFAILWGVENFILALISIQKIYKNPKLLDFIYPHAFLNGAFVWENMLVFGFFHLLSVLVGFISGDLRFFILLFILFWIVRSMGEIFYFFLQQFILPKHHPHNITDNLKPLKMLFRNISDQKCYILLQVFLQTILIVSLFSIIIILLRWNDIGVIPIWK